MPRIVRKRTVKKIAKKTFKFAYKQAVSEVDKRVKLMKSGVNSNYKQSDSTANTGAKSVETVKKTGKKTVKTVKRTVKTTKNTIRTVKNTPKKVKRTIKTAAKVVKTTVKVIKVTVKVISKIIAFLADPVVLVCVLALIIAIYLIVACTAALGGAAAGEANTKRGYSEAAGLQDVPKEFQQGLKVVQTCKENKKKQYDDWIDSHFHYDDNNKRESDLVYMEKYDKNNTQHIYETRFPTQEEKDQVLKPALSWNDGIEDVEILSIAYVLEQKSKNELTPDAEYKIHTVKYTEDLINQVINKVVEWKDSHVKNGGVQCPQCNCVKIVTQVENTEWRKYEDGFNKYDAACNEWYSIHELMANCPVDNSSAESAYWNANRIDEKIQNWKNKYEYDGNYGTHYTPYYNIHNPNDMGYSFYSDLWDNVRCVYENNRNNTEHYTDQITYQCDKVHKHYSEVLEFYNKEQIMTMLNFNDVDKYWEQLTEDYLRNGITPSGP